MHTLACAVTAWMCAACLVHVIAAFRKTPLSPCGSLLVIAAHRFATVPLFVWSSGWHKEGVLRLLRLFPIIEVIFCVVSSTLAPVPLWFEVFSGATNILGALVAFRTNRVASIVYLWIASTAACAYWSTSQRRRSWTEPIRAHEPRIRAQAVGVVVGTALSRGREPTRLQGTAVPYSHDLGFTEEQAGKSMELEPTSHAVRAPSSTMMDPCLLHPMPPSDFMDTITADASEAIYASGDHAVRRSQPGARYSWATAGHDASSPASELGNGNHRTHPFYDATVQAGQAVLADLSATIARPRQHEAAMLTAPFVRGLTDDRMADAGMPRALPPYTPFQPSLDTVMALKVRPRAYTPFLRHHVTYVKLQGVEPSMIQPGYQERLRALIHARTGRWLSHVYVRAGCIELVLDCEEWGSGVQTRGSPCSTWSACDSYGHSVSAEADPDFGLHINGVTMGDSCCGGGEATAAGRSNDGKGSADDAVNSVAGQRIGHQLDGEAGGSISCSDDGREGKGSEAADGQFVTAGNSSGSAAEHRQRWSIGAGWPGAVEWQGSAAVRTQPRTLRATRAVTAHQFGVVAAHASATTSDGCPSLNRSAPSEVYDSACEARCRPMSTRCNYHATTSADIGITTSFMDSLDSSAGGVGTWEVVRALQLQAHPLTTGESITAQCAGLGSGGGGGLGTPRCSTTASMMSPSLLEGRAAAIAIAAAVSPMSRELRRVDGDGSDGSTTSMGLGAVDRSGQMTGGATSANTTASAFDPSMLFVSPNDREGQATTRQLSDSTAGRASCQPRITSLEPQILLAARSLLNTPHVRPESSSASAGAGHQAAAADAMASGAGAATSASSSRQRSFRGQANPVVSIAAEPALCTETPVTLKAIVRCNSHLLNGALELLVRAEGRYLLANVTSCSPLPPPGGDDAAAGNDVDSRMSYNIELSMTSSSSSFSAAAASSSAPSLLQSLRPGILLVDLRVRNVPVHAAPVVVVHDAAMASELCAALATAQLSDDDRNSLLMDLGTWVFHAAAARRAKMSENPRGGCRSNDGPAAAIPGLNTREGIGSCGSEEDHDGNRRLLMLGRHLLSYAKAAGWRCTAASLAADLAAMAVEVDCAPPRLEPAVAAAGRPHAMDGVHEISGAGARRRIPSQGVLAPPAGCTAAVASMSTSAVSTRVAVLAAAVRWAGKVIPMAKTSWQRLHLRGSSLASITGFLSWPAISVTKGAGLPPTVLLAGVKGSAARNSPGFGARGAQGEAQRLQTQGPLVLPSQLEGRKGGAQPQLPRGIGSRPHPLATALVSDVPKPAREHGNSREGSAPDARSSMDSSVAASGSRAQGLHQTALQNATEGSMTTVSSGIRRGIADDAASVACEGGSGGGRGGAPAGASAASDEASAGSAAGAVQPKPLTPLGALLVECGLRRLPSAEESAYQMYAAPRIAAQGYVITFLDLMSLSALTIRIYQNPSGAQSRLTLLACWVGVVEVLMQAGRVFKPPLSLDWPQVHGVCKILRYVSYMACKILCALRVVDMPPGIDNYVTGVAILIQEGLVHPASCLLSLRVLIVLTLLRLIANGMIVSTVDEHFKGGCLGRCGSFVWAAVISAAELLTSGTMHISLRVSYSRRASEKRRQVAARQMLGRR